jgi:Leucine-rich repeat (LRR) protein
MARFRWLAVAVAAVLSFLALPAPFASAAGEFATTVPDTAYRTCITAKLGLDADADPTAEQLATITELSCTGKGIADATGTSAMPNLTKLFLDSNQLTDLAPITSSTGIFSLGVSGNRIATIAPLASLTKLRAVKLNGNRIRDFSVLSNLPEYSRTSSQLYGQAITVDAALGVPALVPTVIGDKAEVVPVYTRPSDVASGSPVTYPAAGDYAWVFKNEGLYLNATVTVHVTDSGVTIPDDALRTCVNSRLSLDASVQPTLAQLATITTGAVNCANKGVKDLTGLNLITGLPSLKLSGNSIADLSPISALPNVTSADLSQNEFTSLAGLGSMPKLGTLQVQQNSTSTKAKLQTLAGINNLPVLTAITANYTAIRSLVPLAGNSSLKNLTATNNRLSDVTPLASVGSQLANVDLSNNQISDLSPLASRTFTKLTVTGQAISVAEATATQEATAPTVTKKDGSVLVATPPSGITVSVGKVTYPSAGSYSWTFSGGDGTSSNQFTGTITQRVKDAPAPVVEVAVPDANLKACLAGLLGQDASAAITEDQLKTLTKVSCIGSDSAPSAKIADLTGADKLVNVTELVLSTNAIADVAPLAGLTKLTKLYLPGNAITDPSSLASLTGLDELLLSYNPVSSIASLTSLVNLTNLEVTQKHGHTGADLTSLDGVQGMTRLTRLVANNSSLTSLEPVTNLTSLKKLYVSNNKIADLTPVQGLTELTGFGAFSNRISDVRPLAGLTKLTDVDLEYNRIGDLSALSGLTHLGYMGLKAQGQVATAASVPAQLTTSAPRPRTHTGAAATVTAPDGVTVTDGKVRYPGEGDYTWSFFAKDDESGTEFFSGTITQPVTAPVSGAADVPDANLRSCLAEAAGLTASAVPTEAELGAVTTADCADKGISDLTGAELLTSATGLKLSGNPLGSIAPLEKLTKLTQLDLARTGLTSVQPLAGLTALTTLDVAGNGLRDLSPLAALTSLSDLGATSQSLTLPDVAGGAAVEIPSVTTVPGAKVAASLPEGAVASGSGASFRRAGTYRWPFASGSFSGAFRQVVTSDVAEPDAQSGASACVAAGKVWVVVERDTGLQQGGCASAFGTGLEALKSAGFTPTGGSYITAIDGYPAGAADTSYWSYWHASNPVTSGSSTRYTWSYSSVSAAGYSPKAGSIEGWRFESWQAAAVAPSWTPVVATSSTPTPTPTPTGTVKTSVSAKKAKLTYGRKATIAVTASPSKAGGVVTAVVGSRTLTAKVTRGKAKLVLPARSLKPGTHRLTVTYVRHGVYKASSTVVKVTVAKATPKVTVKARYHRSAGSVSFTVRVNSSAATPAGYVRVSLDGQLVRIPLDSRSSSAGEFTGIVRKGRHTLTAWYSGSGELRAKTVEAKLVVKR